MFSKILTVFLISFSLTAWGLEKGFTDTSSGKSSLASPDEPSLAPSDWDSFSKSIDLAKRADESTGLSYIISGAAIAVGGAIISHQTDDSLTKLTLSMIQSLGVGGIGYGAGLYSIGSPDEVFRDTLALQKDLTLAQKNEMTENYLSMNREMKRKKRLVSAITYGVIAAFNIFNATQTNDENLKPVYWAIAGAHLALSLSFTF